MTLTETQVREHLEAALRRRSLVRRQLRNLTIAVRDGTVVLEGNVEDIAAKRLIPRTVAAISGASVLDRLRLRRNGAREDDTLRRILHDYLRDEPVFDAYRLVKGGAGSEGAKTVGVEAESGVLRLTGQVGSLSHRRLAEVLAWWVPGCADVDNRLRVMPPEEDSDAEITDALRMVLEKDPWIDAGQVEVRTQDRIVTLTGLLPSDEQKRMAEVDAWYIAGVHDVQNDILSADWLRLQEEADEASRGSFPASDPPSFTAVTGLGGLHRHG